MKRGERFRMRSKYNADKHFVCLDCSDLSVIFANMLIFFRLELLCTEARRFWRGRGKFIQIFRGRKRGGGGGGGPLLPFVCVEFGVRFRNATSVPLLWTAFNAAWLGRGFWHVIVVRVCYVKSIDTY